MTVQRRHQLDRPSFDGFWAAPASTWFHRALYPELWDGCVGAWCPSLGIQGGTLFDLSGHGNLGALTSMDPATDWVVSGRNYALNFDGVNDHVLVDPAVVTAPPLSFSCWIKTASFGSNMSFLGLHDDVGASIDQKKFAFLVLSDRTASLSVQNGGSINTQSTTEKVTTGKWTHLGGTISQAGTTYTNTIYIDGLKRKTGSGSGTGPVPTSTYIGIAVRENGAQINPYHGDLDDIRIYNRLLSDHEMAILAGHGMDYITQGDAASIGRGIAYQVAEENVYWGPVTTPVALTRGGQISVGAPRIDRPSLDGFWAAPASTWFHRALYPELWDGCVGAWCPSLGIQGNAVFDMSGHGSIGAFATGTAVWSVVDRAGYSLDFSAGARVECGDPDEIRVITKNLTVSGWVNSAGESSDSAGIPAIISRWSATDSWFLCWEDAAANRDKARLGVKTSALTDLYSTTSLSLNEWHHVAGTYDGATMRLYVDGLENNTSAKTGSIPTGASTITIGQLQNSNQAYINGHLDDIRIYNRALTPLEIWQLSGFGGNESIGRGIAYQVADDSVVGAAAAAGGPFPFYRRGLVAGGMQQLAGGMF